MNLRAPDRIVSNVELAAGVCGDSAELAAAHARHIATHGNLIPHAFMAEVLARAGACVVARTPEAGAELVAILATLERAMGGGDRETCSVVCISFVWDGEGEPFFAELKPKLGPRLGACVRKRTDARAPVEYFASSDTKLINNTGEHP